MGNKIMNWTFCTLIILDFYPSVRNVYAKLEEILFESHRLFKPFGNSQEGAGVLVLRRSTYTGF